MKILVNLSGEKSRWLSKRRILGYAIKANLDTLVKVDQLYLQRHCVKPLYRSGVRYKNEPNNIVKLGGVAKAQNRIEEFAAIPAVIERGWGDCDDLAPWRVAELREAGEKAKIRITWAPTSRGTLYHIVVRREDNSIEDPSLLLGMKG